MPFRSISILFIIAIAISGCTHKNQKTIKEVSENDKVIYRILLKDSILNWKNSSTTSGIIPPTLGLVEDKDHFNKLFSDIVTNNSSTPMPPAEIFDIDYSKEIGIVLTRGTKPNNGYRTAIRDVQIADTKIKIFTDITVPAGPVSPAEEFRLTLLCVNKIDLPEKPFQMVWLAATARNTWKRR